MKIIAESSSTRTEWALVEGAEVVEHAVTGGLNPYFQSRREISHRIRLELPETFFRRRWEHVYYYGAGCANIEKCKIMEQSLVAQFKTPVSVESDLLGAARGLLVHKPGLACIIGTGSNSCMYDGSHITKNVRSLGFILGDEGGAAYIGKHFISDCLKGLAPPELAAIFFEEYNIRTDAVMDDIYTGTLVSTRLAGYALFLSHHLDHPYVDHLIYDAFKQFFKRNISAYDYLNNPMSIVGSTACRFSEILKRVADDFDAKIDKIIPASMPGLIEFHSDEMLE